MSAKEVASRMFYVVLFTSIAAICVVTWIFYEALREALSAAFGFFRKSPGSDIVSIAMHTRLLIPRAAWTSSAEREVRRLVAVLATNPGQRYPLSETMENAWQVLVRYPDDFDRLSRHVLGPGASFERANVPENIGYDLEVAVRTFEEHYKELFGKRPPLQMWSPPHTTHRGTSSISARIDPVKHVLQKDGEFTDQISAPPFGS